MSSTIYNVRPFLALCVASDVADDPPSTVRRCVRRPFPPCHRHRPPAASHPPTDCPALRAPRCRPAAGRARARSRRPHRRERHRRLRRRYGRPRRPHAVHHPSARLDECLDTVRREFELVSQDMNLLRGQRDDYDGKISTQITELNAIKTHVYELEARHNKIKQGYEDELARLRQELAATRAGELAAPRAPDLRPEFGARPDRDRMELLMREQQAPPPAPARSPAGPRRPPAASPHGHRPRRGPAPGRQHALPALAPGPGAGALPPAPLPYGTPGSFPDEFDPGAAPSELKKEGSDWCAVFSKHVPQRRLDVNLVHTLEHESVVCCVRFSADGKYLATGCNRSAQIYDTKTGAKTCVLVDDAAAKLGDLYIRSLCFSPDGKLLATGAEDKQIRIWDIAKKRIRTVFEGHQQEIYSLDFSRDGRLIVSGSGDKTARIWDMETGAHSTLSITEPADVSDQVDAGVTSVAISPDGRLVAAGSLDTIVRLWDANTGVLIDRLVGHKDSVYSVAFTPDGKGLVSGSLDQTLKHWDLGPLLRHAQRGTEGGAGQSEKGCACTVNFTGHKDYVLSVAVSHDSQWVVSGSKDRCVQFWDLRTAQAQLMLQGHKNSVISIDLSPTGGMLATGSGDWGARLCACGCSRSLSLCTYARTHVIRTPHRELHDAAMMRHYTPPPLKCCTSYPSPAFCLFPASPSPFPSPLPFPPPSHTLPAYLSLRVVVVVVCTLNLC
ncbi:WD40-repeat-containing domain protein [Gautieria morchelliformis]|nr:WD40-repeat-containing domain protein [Gautieria morchelliformis]